MVSEVAEEGLQLQLMLALGVGVDKENGELRHFMASLVGSYFLLFQEEFK